MPTNNKKKRAMQLPLRKCKHCKETFDISEKPDRWFLNHSRWCDKNPKSKVKNQFVKARIEGKEIPKGNKNKGFSGRKHTEKSKDAMKKSALKSNHRRLKKNTVVYKDILLDSQWELKLAKRLDEIGVKWSRPEPLKWRDKEGLLHNYFPDFYLPDYDLYLDPKNKHAYDVQSEKIEILNKTYDNIVFLKTENECETYIPSKE